MDPEKQWNLLVTAIASEEWQSVSTLACQLYIWVGQGGPPPQIALGEDFAINLWNWKVARFACLAAGQLAAEHHVQWPLPSSDPTEDAVRESTVSA